MKDATIFRTGIVGSIIAAVCCATPILVISLGALGLSAWLGWVDYVLIPALVLFLAITAYGLWRQQREAACCAPETQSSKTQSNKGRA
ncbi:MAG: mercury resistance system transport protein MerF [Rhizobiales bacterium]|nr:mercury resistance system transport protein MerF [Hyphomicrobiales bacterium]